MEACTPIEVTILIGQLSDFVHLEERGRVDRVVMVCPLFKSAELGRRCALRNPQRSGLTVLVVEDDTIVRLNAVEHLKNEGFVVLEAGSGEAALSYLDMHGQIDLLFTDIRLGGEINGWDVGEAFRVRFPNIAVLYTSGNSISPPRNVERSRFFMKPYEPEEIADACRELCKDRPW